MRWLSLDIIPINLHQNKESGFIFFVENNLGEMYNIIIFNRDWLSLGMTISIGMIEFILFLSAFKRIANYCVDSRTSCRFCTYQISKRALTSVPSQVRSCIKMANRNEGYDSRFNPSEQRSCWDDLFGDEDSLDQLQLFQDTPMGKLRLLHGVRKEWLPNAVEAKIFAGKFDSSSYCWLILCSNAANRGIYHPLVVEFAVATVLKDLNICPEPLYLSSCVRSVYGSFTDVDERVLVYKMPGISTFITQFAFSHSPHPTSHVRRCCDLMLEVVDKVVILHSQGVAHGALADDGVIIGEGGCVMLVNFGNVSFDQNAEELDINAIYEIFSYILSRARTRRMVDIGVLLNSEIKLSADAREYLNELVSPGFDFKGGDKSHEYLKYMKECLQKFATSI